MSCPPKLQIPIKLTSCKSSEFKERKMTLARCIFYRNLKCWGTNNSRLFVNWFLIFHNKRNFSSMNLRATTWITFRWYFLMQKGSWLVLKYMLLFSVLNSSYKRFVLKSHRDSGNNAWSVLRTTPNKFLQENKIILNAIRIHFKQNSSN